MDCRCWNCPGGGFARIGESAPTRTADIRVAADGRLSRAAALVEETEREIRKHPEKKEEKTRLLATRQKDAAEMVDFLNTRSLRTARLDPGHAEISGWVLFSSKNRRIDEFEKREEFVLRVPLEGRVMEFPFSLPTTGGDLILRRRTGN